jgi:hypothetical protein
MVSYARTGKVLSAVGVVVFGLWTGAKLVLDSFGRVTALEELSGSKDLFPRFLHWLFSTPWYVPAILGACLTAILAYVLLFGRTEPRLRRLRTSAVIRFIAGNNNPEKIEVRNIWNWYALCNIVYVHEQGGAVRELRTWSIFLVFDEPISAKQVLVESDAPLPVYEVKNYGPRHAVIAFSGDIPTTVIRIRVAV